MNFESVFESILKKYPHWNKDTKQGLAFNGHADSFRTGAFIMFEHFNKAPEPPPKPKKGQAITQQAQAQN